MASIKELVAGSLTKGIPKVRERVLDLLVEEEISKRVTAVVTLVKKLDSLRKEGYKFKPDDITYDVEGKVLSEGYKKETVEAIKKNRDEQAKLSDALDKALNEENPSFEQVLKLAA